MTKAARSAAFFCLLHWQLMNSRGQSLRDRDVPHWGASPASHVGDDLCVGGIEGLTPALCGWGASMPKLQTKKTRQSLAWIKPADVKKPPPDHRWGFFRITSLTITYFHTGCSTIIGAKLFHGPVRDGKGWDQLAMVIRHNLYWHLSSMERQSLNLEEAKIG
jgi:hypothetical protein